MHHPRVSYRPSPLVCCSLAAWFALPRHGSKLEISSPSPTTSFLPFWMEPSLDRSCITVAGRQPPRRKTRSQDQELVVDDPSLFWIYWGRVPCMNACLHNGFAQWCVHWIIPRSQVIYLQWPVLLFQDSWMHMKKAPYVVANRVCCMSSTYAVWPSCRPSQGRHVHSTSKLKFQVYQAI